MPINKSLSEGFDIDKLKIAKVIPIFKAYDKQRLKNYRPISLLPAVSIVLEKVIFNAFTIGSGAIHLNASSLFKLVM